MDNYILVEVQDAPEAQLSRSEELPFPRELTQPEGLLLFELRRNTKLGGMVARLEKELKKAEVRGAIFHGVGECCVKCVSCVEIVKSNWSRAGSRVNEPPLHQWTATRVRKFVDVWAPEREEDVEKLDRIVVEKNVPQLFILLSKSPFPDQYKGGSQQTSNELHPFFLNSAHNDANSSRATSSRSGKKCSYGTKKLPNSERNQWRRPDRVGKIRLSEMKNQERLKQKRNREGGDSERSNV